MGPKPRCNNQPRDQWSNEYIDPETSKLLTRGSMFIETKYVIPTGRNS